MHSGTRSSLSNALLMQLGNEENSSNFNEMAEFPFNWQLHPTGNMHRKKNCLVSNLKINSEWRLECLWSQQCNVYKPESVEIHRNSTAGEIYVSGTYQLMRSSQCLLKHNFFQLIDDGSTTASVVLDYSSSDYYGGSYSMTGTLKFTRGMMLKENAKDVEFQSLLSLSNDFASLLDPNSTYFSDMNLKCGSDVFPAHKVILSSRSPVFAAMFAAQMKEKQLNQVDITDIKPSVLKCMLNYIYTGKTGQLSVQSAGDLLFAADKYQLQDMKRVCSDYLKSCLSTENVLNTLVLGYYHDQGLKVFAMDFICNSCEDFDVLEKTAEWITLRKKIPSLAMDVLTCLVKSKDERLKEKK